MLGRLAVVLVLIVVGLAAPTAYANSKYAAFVMDYSTGEVLHSRRADVPLYPASLTKMMTLMMLFDALERGQLAIDTKLKVSRRAADMPASKLGLRAGSTISVDQAIQAITVRSANDVAVVIAEALGGTESEFAELMTNRARSIGMRNTTFRNASGLPNRQQKSTARDMAKLAHRLIRHYAGYYHYFSQPSFSFGGRTYRSHNRLVKSYRGMDGLKTGYTRASGFNLASSAIRNGRRVIVIVFGGRSAKTRDAAVARLMDLGFERLPKRSAEPLVASLPKPRPGTAVAVPTGIAALIAEAGGHPEPRPAARSTESASTARQTEPSGLARPKSVLDALTEHERAALTKTVTADAMTVAPPPEGASATAALAIGPVDGLIAGPAKAAAIGDYAVQVGAFHDPGLARQAAHGAAALVPQILLRGDIKVSPLQGRRKMVYRARVAGFDRDVADKACGLLQAHRQECFVIRTRPGRLAADSTS